MSAERHLQSEAYSSEAHKGLGFGAYSVSPFDPPETELPKADLPYDGREFPLLEERVG